MKIAEKIAEDLFTSGFGNKASRLVFEYLDGTTGVGWSKQAVIKVIAGHLASQPSDPEDAYCHHCHDIKRPPVVINYCSWCGKDLRTA